MGVAVVDGTGRHDEARVQPHHFHLIDALIREDAQALAEHGADGQPRVSGKVGPTGQEEALAAVYLRLQLLSGKKGEVASA